MSRFDPTRRWLEIALQQERLRRTAVDARAMLKALRGVLEPLTLGDRPRCSRSAKSWLCRKGDRRRGTELTFSAQTQEEPDDHPALKLQNLPSLEDGARLTVRVLLINKRLEKFNIGLAGELRGGAGPWFVRVDLDPPLLADDVDLDGPEHELFERLRTLPRDEEKRRERKGGAGLGSHAWPHCHVGRTPSDKLQQTRVPVPFIAPPDALAWVLATADSTLEPCPWLDPP